MNSNLTTPTSVKTENKGVAMSAKLPYPNWIEPGLDIEGIEEELDSIHYSMETELPYKLDKALRAYNYEYIKYFASEIARMALSAEELIAFMNQENHNLNQTKDLTCVK